MVYDWRHQEENVAVVRIMVVFVMVVGAGGCASILQYAPPTVISGSNVDVKVRAGIRAGHPGGAATDHCRRYGKSAVMSDDPPVDGPWANTKIFSFECE